MHTPGPWHREGLMIYDAQGQVVAIVTARSKPGEAEANGNLVTAAPGLLTLCEELLESAYYWSEYDVPIGIVDRMKAMVATVKGKA